MPTNGKIRRIPSDFATCPRDQADDSIHSIRSLHQRGLQARHCSQRGAPTLRPGYFDLFDHAAPWVGCVYMANNGTRTDDLFMLRDCEVFLPEAAE
jgi:hypothetical protein